MAQRFLPMASRHPSRVTRQPVSHKGGCKQGADRMRPAPSLIIIRQMSSLMGWTFCPRPRQIVWPLCNRIAQRLGKPRIFETAHDLHHGPDETDNPIEVALT